MPSTKTAIAISASDFDQFGCPSCGSILGSMVVWGGSSIRWLCECSQNTLVVRDGLDKPTIGFWTGSEAIYPKVVPHPRRDQPADKEKPAHDQAVRSTKTVKQIFDCARNAQTAVDEAILYSELPRDHPTLTALRAAHSAFERIKIASKLDTITPMDSDHL